jgi:hypothetical protein
MPYSKRMIGLIAAALLAISSPAQYTDTIPAKNNSTEKKIFPYKSLFIPGLMIAYGIIALENDGLQNINKEFQEEIWTEHPHQLKHIDNYLQFTPAIAVYGLNAIGIKGKNNLMDRSMLYLLSNIIMNTTVHSVKKISHRLRPDGSDYYSFPSGHTAEAFTSAEFLYQEYKNISPWYGVAGYAIAATTGCLRMYNNKHWFSDIVAGAGVGIASVKITYWLYPKIKALLFKDKFPHTAFLPFYSSHSVGLSLQYYGF